MANVENKAAEVLPTKVKETPQSALVEQTKPVAVQAQLTKPLEAKATSPVQAKPTTLPKPAAVQQKPVVASASINEQQKSVVRHFPSHPSIENAKIKEFSQPKPTAKMQAQMRESLKVEASTSVQSESKSFLVLPTQDKSAMVAQGQSAESPKAKAADLVQTKPMSASFPKSAVAQQKPVGASVSIREQQKSETNQPQNRVPMENAKSQQQTNDGSITLTFMTQVKEWWGKRSTFEKEVIGFVVAPTVAVFGYVSLWASPMYISETQFAVRSGTEQPTSLDLASQVFRTNNSSVQDAQVVEAYIRSPDVLEALDQKLNVIDYYSSHKWDFISRLTSSPTLFDKQTFWNRVSNPVVNPDNGIVTYSIKAYDPKMAQAIGQEVLNQSEGLINEMNERARKDMLDLAQKEVDLARDRMKGAQKALERFRDMHKELDPQATAVGLQTLVMQLEGERAKLKAEIADASTYMQKSAPAMVSMQSKLDSIELQLSREKARLVGTREGLAINAWVSEYETLMIESEFSKKQLTTAMTALETARASLMSKARYIVPIQKPTLPDESRYPLTWVITLVTFLGLFLLYGLIRLIIASIREHAGF